MAAFEEAFFGKKINNDFVVFTVPCIYIAELNKNKVLNRVILGLIML